MTGHNHHPDCPCGWCVYGDRDHGVHKGITFGEAKLLLKNHGVTSRTSCFVIPNARCPVCQASVYYYANDLGSRVFFDHLGPPWPKHGCTDNPRIPMPSASPPKLRELALAERLLMSAQLLRESVGNSYSYSSRGWKVLQVVQRSLNGQNCTIKTRHVNSKEGGPIPFNYASADADFEIGDLLYLKGEEVEYLDKKTLQPRKFHAPLSDFKLIKSAETSHQTKPRLVRPNILAPAGTRSRSGAMTNMDALHFPNDAKELEIFLRRLGGIIDNYRFRGIKGTSEIATRLNRDGYHTLRGSPWTVKLVGFLLDFLNSRKTARRKNENTPSHSVHTGRAAKTFNSK